MTPYTVTLGNNSPATIEIEADTVSCDPHWVSFRVREKPEPSSPVHCEACGEPTGVARVRPASREIVVALFPTSQVRRVVKA